MMKKSRRPNSDAALNITSMMDMMTIILVFLLKQYGTDDISVAPSEDLQIPVSSAMKPPKLAVNVVVSRKDIVVDGEWVLDLEKGVDPETGQELTKIPEAEKRGQRITQLHKVLFDKAQNAKELGQRTGAEDFEFKGEVLLQCDKRLPFSVIREVMFTAGQAQFGNFRFIVIKGSG
jgi:biopolymer transport protein ExbD